MCMLCVVSKGIVDLHKGSVDLQSESGGGSNFSFHIPMYHMMTSVTKDDAIIPPDVTRSSLVKISSSGDVTRESLLRDKKVLVVDDAKMIRQILCRVLKSKNVHCYIEAEDGSEAVKRVKEMSAKGDKFDVSVRYRWIYKP